MAFSLNSEQIEKATNLYATGIGVHKIAPYFNVSYSTMRTAMLNANIQLRDIKGAIRLSMKYRKKANRTNFVISEETRRKISEAKKGNGYGLSIKPNGYLEITMGVNKGKSLHRVIMEEYLQRKLTKNEHMTLHAKLNYKNRRRLENGFFA